MRFAPWQLLAVIVAGWMSQQQQQVTDYLRDENRVLREKLGKKRVRLPFPLRPTSPASRGSA